MGAASIMINIPLVTTTSDVIVYAVIRSSEICHYQDQGHDWVTQGEGSRGKTRLRYFGAKRCDLAPTSTIPFFVKLTPKNIYVQ